MRNKIGNTPLSDLASINMEKENGRLDKSLVIDHFVTVQDIKIDDIFSQWVSGFRDEMCRLDPPDSILGVWLGPTQKLIPDYVPGVVRMVLF